MKWQDIEPDQPDRITRLNEELLAALKEIAERGPIDGYSSAGALRLRLVATQSIARAAIAKAEQP